MQFLSQALIPLILFGVALYALLKKVDAFDAFTAGALEGCQIAMKLVPTMAGLLVAVRVLRDSGCLEFLAELLSKFSGKIGFSGELLPLAMVRMLSSSAAIGLLTDLYREHGTDTRIGLTASLMMCCTETVFYTISVYFMAAKVRKMRWTLAGAFLSMAAGLGASLWLGNYLTQ